MKNPVIGVFGPVDADAEAVAAIARAGLGEMSGYAEVLGDEGVSVVAAYVWQQAEAGWPREPRGT